MSHNIGESKFKSISKDISTHKNLWNIKDEPDTKYSEESNNLVPEDEKPGIESFEEPNDRTEDAVDFDNCCIEIKKEYIKVECSPDICSLKEITEEIEPMNISKEEGILASKSEDGLKQNDTTSKNLTKRRISKLSDIDVSTSNNEKDDTYVQKKRKAKRNSGKEYRTQSGKIIPERKFENKNCHCVKGCINLISAEERQKIFDKFWSLADFSKQNILLNNLTQKCGKNRHRPRNNVGPPRSCVIKYHLNISGEDILVCKRFFLDTFNISKGRVERALKAKNLGEDFRGRMKGSSRKTDEREVNGVKEHIQSFPQLQSHCTRCHILLRKYLNSELNIRKMYYLYVDKCKKINTIYVKESIYRNIFNKEFNLYFDHSHKDMCQNCESLNMKIKTSCNIDEKALLMGRCEIGVESRHSTLAGILNILEGTSKIDSDQKKTLKMSSSLSSTSV